MAKVSVYVSDEMKARMEAAGAAINWSEVARPAFEQALTGFRFPRDLETTGAVGPYPKPIMDLGASFVVIDGRRFETVELLAHAARAIIHEEGIAG